MPHSLAAIVQKSCEEGRGENLPCSTPYPCIGTQCCSESCWRQLRKYVPCCAARAGDIACRGRSPCQGQHRLVLLLVRTRLSVAPYPGISSMWHHGVTRVSTSAWATDLRSRRVFAHRVLPLVHSPMPLALRPGPRYAFSQSLLLSL